MNVSDSERISTTLARDGFEMTANEAVADVLVAVSTADGQQMRPVGHGGRQVEDDLSVSRGDDRHQVHLTPDLRRLRPEIQPLNRERLVVAIDRRPQNDQLLRAVAVSVVVPAALVLGVREIGP